LTHQDRRETEPPGDAERGSHRSEENRLGDERCEHRCPLRSECQDHGYLAPSFGERHRHRVVDDEEGDEQRDGATHRQQRRKRTEDALQALPPFAGRTNDGRSTQPLPERVFDFLERP
jgi:hypothetical protein